MLVKRKAVEALDAVLGEQYLVLDHGFVRVVDYMGDDGAIVQAARVSYGAGTTNVREDRGLIRYLFRNKHTTPFEMCEIKLHVRLPIFVARQWIRHRTANVNEVSGRYSVLPSDYYVPQAEVLCAQSKTNKQGREAAPLMAEHAEDVRNLMREDAARAYAHYSLLTGRALEGGDRWDSDLAEQVANLPEFSGIAKELARINLPVSGYTEWYWKIDLHNLFNFLRLRFDSHAQYEIREYARVILDLVRLWVPLAYAAFVDYVHEARTLSRMEISALRKALAKLSLEDRHDIGFNLLKAGCSKREIQEFEEFFFGGQHG